MKATPLRLLIHGASGRMGRALLRLASADPRFSIVAAVSRTGVAIAESPVPVTASSALAGSPDFDVAIDFSLPKAFEAVLTLCRERRTALVSGTTGFTPGQQAALEEAGLDIPIVWASNFSLGVVVLEDLVRRATHALAEWQVDITEVHHVHKKDAPSGTAITLAKAAALGHVPLPPIRSVREGEVIGDHTVRITGIGETLELRHRADSRDIFALGALHAARRLIGRPPACYSLPQLILGD